MSIRLPLANAIERVIKETKTNITCELISCNKVGNSSEGNDSNTTLPVEYNEVQNLAILDSGVGLALITMQV